MAEQEQEWVTVTYGEEKFGIRGTYSSFTIGQASYRTTVKPGETPEQAYERAYRSLESMARKAFERKRREFMDRLKGVEDEASRAR